MSRQNYLFTSESVSEGHPDKVCDRISDEVVDLFFREAAKAGMDAAQVRVACETLATTNRVVIAGEVRTSLDEKAMKSKVKSAARKAIKAIGYEQDGFHWKKCQDRRAAARPVGRHRPGRRRRRQQGRRRGRPGHHVRLCLPRDARADAGADLLRPQDPRSAGQGPPRQAKAAPPSSAPTPRARSRSSTRTASRSASPRSCSRPSISTRACPRPTSARSSSPIIRETLPEGWITKETVWHVNPTGKFVIGGPDGDAGLTGRKIIVDTYGGAAPHGGGAFSGKDPTKVDRSAAYAARYLAKNVVAAKLAERCTIQLSYAIGVAKPLSIYVDLHGTGKVDEAKLETALGEVMDLTPRGIRTHLQLNKPIYAKSAAYGHFGRKAGRDGSFSWEKTDLVDALKKAVA